MELLRRYTNNSKGADVTLYYYNDSKDYVVTMHWTNNRHVIGAGWLPVKMVQEQCTDNLKLAEALFNEEMRYINSML